MMRNESIITVYLPDKVSFAGGYKKLPGVFIRFGALPRGGKPSMNYLTGKPEKGVSVYRAWHDPRTGKYVLATPSLDVGTLESFKADKTKAYVVKGSLVKGEKGLISGGDFEDLLDPRTVRIVKEVPRSQIVDDSDPWMTIDDEDLITFDASGKMNESQVPNWDKEISMTAGHKVKNPKRPYVDARAEGLIKKENEVAIQYWLSRFQGLPEHEKVWVMVELLRKARASRDSVDIVRGVVSRGRLLDILDTARIRMIRTKEMKMRNPSLKSHRVAYQEILLKVLQAETTGKPIVAKRNYLKLLSVRDYLQKSGVSKRTIANWESEVRF